MEYRESFGVTLGAPNEPTDDNRRTKTNSDFSVDIPNGVNLDNGEWDVGLIDVILPNKVININDDNNSFSLLIRNLLTPIWVPHSASEDDGSDDAADDSDAGPESDGGDVEWVSTSINAPRYNDRRDLYNYRRYAREMLPRDIRRGSVGYSADINDPANLNIVHYPYGFKCSVFDFAIPTGAYLTPLALTSTINRLLNMVAGELFGSLRGNMTDAYPIEIGDDGIKVELYLNFETDIVTYLSTSSNCIGLAFNPKLARILGMDSVLDYGTYRSKLWIQHPEHGFYDVVFQNDIDRFPHKVDVTLGHSNLYIYTNLMEFRLVGSGQYRLLRLLVYNMELTYESPVRSVQFKHIQYFPVAGKRFERIYILIRNELGDAVQFIPGERIVRIQFKKK